MVTLRCVRALSIEQFEVSRWHGVGNLRPMGLQSFGRAEAWLESPQSGEMGSLKRHHSERMVWVPSGFLACDGALPRKRTDPGAVCGRARRAAGCERIIRSCHGCSLSWLQGRASVGPSAVRPLASARGKRDTARGRVSPEERQVSPPASGRGEGGSGEATCYVGGWPASRNNECAGSPWATRAVRSDAGTPHP